MSILFILLGTGASVGVLRTPRASFTVLLADPSGLPRRRSSLSANSATRCDPSLAPTTSSGNRCDVGSSALASLCKASLRAPSAA
ncbi:hypothetical protein T492DRAFT_996823 [Pavlovales sp. CCMP2436]|nr:hypothetical protein T492DRAFT_996823 [Pavlovales sp. CCMP2436]